MGNMLNKFLAIGFLFLSSNACSQSVEISLGQEMSLGKLDYFWFGKVTDDDNRRDIIGVDFFISVAAKVKSDFYLRTGFGTNDFKDLAFIEWEVNGVKKSSFSYIRMNQIVMYVLPEYRCNISDTNVFFVNAGFSLTKVLYGTDRNFAFSDNRSGIAINSGLNVGFNKNLGMALSLGYRKNVGVGHNTEFPDISIQKFSLQLAVVYSI